jgi:hypothetical protein
MCGIWNSMFTRYSVRHYQWSKFCLICTCGKVYILWCRNGPRNLSPESVWGLPHYSWISDLCGLCNGGGLAVSKFQDTRTATSLACIETRSSRHAAVEESVLGGRDHTNDITQYTLLLPQYINTHNRSLRLVRRSFLQSFLQLRTQNRSKAFAPFQPHTDLRSANLCTIHQQSWRPGYTSEVNSAKNITLIQVPESCLSIYLLHCLCNNAAGASVTLVEALCYEPEGRWFESRWGHWILFSLSNPSSRTMTLELSHSNKTNKLHGLSPRANHTDRATELSHSLTEISTRNLPWG